MKNFIEKIKLLYREQPLFFVTIFLVLVFAIFVIFVSQNRDPKTGGDRASATSDAFLVYKESPFLPTGNVYSDQQIRRDVAYYARKQYSVYDPNKNPAVVFNVSKFTQNESGKRTFSGSFEKQKGDVKVDIELLQNNRVKVSISSNKDTDINDSLPSASAENKYIASLPFVGSTYSISYSSEANSFQITVFDSTESTLLQAKTELKKNIPENYSDEKVSVIYPAYLKGEPQYGGNQPSFDPNLADDVGDGGAPVSD